MPLPPTPVVLPMWRGRRGIVTTVICGALGLACAIALWVYADRGAVQPACMRYGEAHGLTYVDYRVNSSHRRASSVCIFKTRTGGGEDVSLPDAASWWTDTWVGVAFSPEFTWPALALFFAIAWTAMLPSESKRP